MDNILRPISLMLLLMLIKVIVRHSILVMQSVIPAWLSFSIVPIHPYLIWLLRLFQIVLHVRITGILCVAVSRRLFILIVVVVPRLCIPFIIALLASVPDHFTLGSLVMIRWLRLLTLIGRPVIVRHGTEADRV